MAASSEEREVDLSKCESLLELLKGSFTKRKGRLERIEQELCTKCQPCSELEAAWQDFAFATARTRCYTVEHRRGAVISWTEAGAKKQGFLFTKIRISMSESFEATGGARIGWTNATWPLAKLRATSDSLRVTVGVLGEYSFTPETIVSITHYTMIPVLAWGIRIQHCAPEYPARVLFWCFDSPEVLLKGIREAGFVPRAQLSALPPRQGWPVRWQAVVPALLVWHGLVLVDLLQRPRVPPVPGPLSLLAIGSLIAAVLGMMRVPAFQRVILKPGRNIGEVRPALNLLLVTSGFMFVVLLIMALIRSSEEPAGRPQSAAPALPSPQHGVELRLLGGAGGLRYRCLNSMTRDDFWRHIEVIDREALAEEDEQAAVRPLQSRLKLLSTQKIEDFHEHLSQVLFALDGRVYAEESGESRGSDDGFLYARCYVVAQGREYYEATLRDPRLMPKTIEQWCEALLSVHWKAWAVLTGAHASAFPFEASVSYESGSNEALRDR